MYCNFICQLYLIKAGEKYILETMKNINIAYKGTNNCTNCKE